MSIRDVKQDEFLWVQKYRPRKIDDVILPAEIKEQFKGYVTAGRIPNLLLSGGAGVGKKTIAQAMANEVGADFMVVNASSENGVDNIRTKITQFASTVSFSNAKKVTLLDEADFLSTNAQAALRNLAEEFSANHSLILTCNFKNKIIEPLHSRCHCIEFKISNNEKPALATAFFKRVTQILDLEKVEYDKKVVAEVVNQFFPDFRRCLNELQKYASGGKIDSGIMAMFSSESFNDLINILKNKKFSEMRKWVAQNSDTDSIRLFRMFYDAATEKLEPKAIPALVLLLGEYQYKASFVADQEINTAAFLTSMMMDSNIAWKGTK